MDLAQNIIGPISQLTIVRIERNDGKDDPKLAAKISQWTSPNDIVSFIHNTSNLTWQLIVATDSYGGCYAISGEYKISLLPRGSYGIDQLKDDFNEFMSRK